METIKLRYFTVIAQSGSLTKASRILNISHGGLSKAMSSLEKETKLRLFRAQGRGLEITDEGRWFYAKAQEILRLTDEIEQQRKPEIRSTRIGLSDVLGLGLAKFLAEEISEPLALIEADVGEIEGKILKHEIDFGLAFVPAPHADLEYLEIGKARFNSYSHVSLQKKMAAKEIPYIVPATDYPFNPIGYQLRDGWPVNLERSPYFAVSRMSVALELLKSGHGALYMPDFLAERIPHIAKIEEHRRAQTQRMLYLIKKKSEEESLQMKKAAKILRREILRSN